MPVSLITFIGGSLDLYRRPYEAIENRTILHRRLKHPLEAVYEGQEAFIKTETEKYRAVEWRTPDGKVHWIGFYEGTN